MTQHLTLAIARRVNVTAIAVMEGNRIFDLVRIRERDPVRLARRLADYATFYDAVELVFENGATARLGFPTIEIPTTTYDVAVVHETILPGYARGDLQRLHEFILKHYPAVARYVPRTRFLTPEHTSLLAAVALGAAHHIL